jgi:hypothetical protein
VSIQRRKRAMTALGSCHSTYAADPINLIQGKSPGCRFDRCPPQVCFLASDSSHRCATEQTTAPALYHSPAQNMELVWPSTPSPRRNGERGTLHDPDECSPNDHGLLCPGPYGMGVMARPTLQSSWLIEETTNLILKVCLFMSLNAVECKS